MANTIYGIRNCDTMKKPSMIKRPVLETRGQVLVGFEPEVYASALRTSA